MMKSKRWIVLGIFSLVLSGLALPVGSARGQQDEKGIPSTAFARLKIDKGTAWVRTSDSGDWQESVSNFPLVEKSRVSVPEGSEAEILFHGSQSLVLRGGSEVDIQKLGEKEVSYRLRSGKAELSLRAENFAPVRMTVPGNHDVRADAPGRYSLSTDGTTTRFGVTAGAGAVTGKGGSDVMVKAGEEASIGDKDKVRVGRVGMASSETVPEEAVVSGPVKEAGIPPSVDEELQPYGEWVSTPEYGYAWRPYVEDGWEPYYYGKWVWVSPYGWTWVAYEPWGWWPYHTGWWWPSPVFGWVWCPFNSFVSFNFVFGNTIFFEHHARFFPGNVRFFGRDRFVRWVPERPGVVSSRTLPRNDTRLAGWNRPVDRGSVMVRHNGGAPVAWEGRGGRTSVTAGNHETRMRGGRGGAAVRAPVTRNRNLGTPPSRSGNHGVRAPASSRGGGVQSFSRGGGRMSGSPGVRTGPGRPFVGRAPSRQTGDGFRGVADSPSPRNATSAGSRGFNEGFRSPASSGRGGGSGGFRGFR